MNELFWTASEKERLKGSALRDGLHHCLLCTFTSEDGYVYPKGKEFVDARKEMALHIETIHGSVIETLTNLDKKQTGLSAHQSKIIKCFYQGMSDYEVQKAMEIGSISTIRNHRHALKDKERQAKTLTTIMTLLAEVTDDKKMLIKPHKTATMLDNRYDITFEEHEKVIEKYFPDGPEGQLSTFYTKEKNKIILLGEIIKRFEPIRRYTEKEVDAILKDIYLEDYVLIRRYLIQYGFLNREKDGSVYWLKEAHEKQSTGTKKKKSGKVEMNSDKKKALTKAYKAKVASEEIKSGVYQVRNMLNGKVYIATARNIKKLEGIKFQLNNRSFMNSDLQQDWSALGEENFTIEVLESFEEDGHAVTTSKKMKDLEQKWLEKTQPYGDKGYHRIRRK